MASGGLLLRVRIALGLRLGKLALELGDGTADLLDGAAGPRQGLGVGAAPVRVLGLAQRLLDLAQAALEPVLGVARDRRRPAPSAPGCRAACRAPTARR